MGSKPFVSVIVPVYNDAVRLERCLEVLRSQSYPKELYEIIVVDNGSTDDPKTVVDRYPGFRYVYEARPGPAAARNAGLNAAKAGVIGFTDADCTPYPDWLEKGVRALLSQARAGVIGGRIDHYFKDPDRPTAIELFNKSYFDQEKYIRERHFAAGANCFTHRSVFESVGTFNDAFVAPACEDREWGERVHAKGYPIGYADDCVVLHPVRRSLGELYSKLKALAIGNFEYEKMTQGQAESSAAAETIALFKPPFRSALRRLSAVNGLWLRVRLYGVILFAYYLRLGMRLWMRAGGRPAWRTY